VLSCSCPHLHAAATRPTEGGFTIVELIIGAVLLMLVLGGVGTVLLSTSQSSSNARSKQAAQARADHVISMLTDDLRSVIAPPRANPDTVATRDELKLYLSEAAPPIVVADVIEASPTRLVLRSTNVPGIGRIGCIEWRVAGGAIERRTFADWNACGGAPLTSEQVVTLLPGASTSVFSYRYQAPAPGSYCTSTLLPAAATANWDQRNRISMVKVNLQSFASDAAIAGTQLARSAILLGSRNTDQYQYALGWTE
jgi:type II secretory pathway component PulJ